MGNTGDFSIALAMIVKGSDEEAEMLKRCLENISPWVDGIFITITQENKKVEKVAELFGANISHFKWCNDFSKARNFNFNQVPKEYEYIIWADADDMFRGLEKLRPTIEKNRNVDVFSVFYYYAFDQYKNPTVVHQKSQIVKNDGSVEWQGALHEDFKENRSLIVKFIDGIERLHLSNDDRFDTNKKRNVEVAEQQVKDSPEDPRSYWNLGNALKADFQDDRAKEVLNKFLSMSTSDEEKYIVNMRLAEIELNQGNSSKALDYARGAVGIKLKYPDAYFVIGYIYYTMERWKEAAEHYKQGLETSALYGVPYYSIIVYNPRDYDYVPMKMLALCYIYQNRPDLAVPLLEGCLKIYPKDDALKSVLKGMKKELKTFEKAIETIEGLKKTKSKKKIKETLDSLPKEIQSHPLVCRYRNLNFIKEKSSGKDLVIYCGMTSEEWTPETAKTNGIGGSEEAVINLSEGLSKKGWNVTVYNNCGHKPVTFGKVTYKPYWTWNVSDKQDVVILWRNPLALDFEINADKVYLDLHDVVKEKEFTPSRIKKVTKIFVKSKFHRSLYPDVSDNKFVIVPNGLPIEDLNQDIKRDPYLLINTSSPDRSLGSAIDLFKRVKSVIPKAKFAWAYGWRVFDYVHGDDAKIMEWKQDIIKKMEETEDVIDLGRIGHSDVNKLYQKAGAFFYPCEFAEIDCISARKAQAGGAIPLTTDFAALDETVQFGTKVHSKKTKDDWCKDFQFDFSLQEKRSQDELVKKTIEYLKNIPSEGDRKEMREWTKQFSWGEITNKWNEELCGQPNMEPGGKGR